jgi:cytochrome bd-type quinol oxidase subunit 2
MNNTENEVDINKDGLVSETEAQAYERKAVNRRRMAWVSLVAMIATAAAILFVVPETKLDRIKDMLDLYWIALGSIVGAYVGISTWMSKK